MPYVRVWVHIVWSTKNRISQLTESVRPIIFQHIRENAEEKGIFLVEVNGYTDHVHCLVSLKRNQTVSKVVHLLKGESSHWINQQKLLPEKLKWQSEYYAVSVGESGIARVRKYIQNQEKHHQNQDFREEISLLEKRYGFVKMNG